MSDDAGESEMADHGEMLNCALGSALTGPVPVPPFDSRSGFELLALLERWSIFALSGRSDIDPMDSVGDGIAAAAAAVHALIVRSWLATLLPALTPLMTGAI